MSKLISPKNWSEDQKQIMQWRTPVVQRNICPKCHYYGDRFSHDGLCQFCGYRVEKKETITLMPKTYTLQGLKKLKVMFYKEESQNLFLKDPSISMFLNWLEEKENKEDK